MSRLWYTFIQLYWLYGTKGLEMEYCDSCVEAVKEEGATSEEEAYEFLEVGSYMIPDHECDNIIEPEISCDCEGHK